MLYRDPLAFAPRLDPASRTLGEMQSASRPRRATAVCGCLVACRLPAWPTSTAGGHWWRRSGLRSARPRDTHDPPTRCCARLSQPDRHWVRYGYQASRSVHSYMTTASVLDALAVPPAKLRSVRYDP